ncbi:MAG: type III pantothenate kinase, partial [Dehalococcoidales bacterium]|nr:type III pantothenate kinase [Dehalococcoidales bacterium]
MKENILLAIDIGNTETTLGVFNGDELKATWHTATVIHRTADEHAILLFNLLGRQGLQASDVKEVSLCS